MTQLEESQTSIRIQGLYRLSEDQKSYLNSFQSVKAKTSSGEASDKMITGWEDRLITYKEALKNSIYYSVRKIYKSRPLYITGKIFLAESPHFSLISGEWKVIVKTHIIITSVDYLDSY